MIKVKEYIKNVGKSTVYTAADLLGENYSSIKDFKNTNQEVFKESYVSIRDYRNTFSKVKKHITESNVYAAANLGINNLIDDIKTGNFYNKERELEYENKFGGDFSSDWDMDDSEFDWQVKDDVSDGDKIIATAIKKNNKISTAIMADAMAQGHKAIIDSSRENTTTLYVQQEKIFNKIGGGLDNITSLLKNSNEVTFKNQTTHFKNSATFFSNIEKKSDRIVAQLDEMLEMQRNLYKAQDQSENNRKKNSISDITSNGIPDLKAYKEVIKGNIKDQVNYMTGGILGMMNMGGADMMKMSSSNWARSAMKGVLSKVISKEFKSVSKEFDKSLRGLFTSLISKANTAKDSDNPLLKAIGNIFGVKVDKESTSLRTDKYNRGPIPFDGESKIALTTVLPYYLRKMTAILTGEDEQVFDYKTGKWTTVRNVQKQHREWKKSGSDEAFRGILDILSKSLGKNPSNIMESSWDKKYLDKQIKLISESLYDSEGDFSILNKPYELGIDPEIASIIKQALQDDQYHYKTSSSMGNKGRINSKITGIDRSRGNGIRTGINKRAAVMGYAGNVYDIKSRKASHMRELESDPTAIERILYSEGIGIDESKLGIRNKHGDFDKKTAFKSPLAQAMKYAEDQYGYTIFDYLKYIKQDLTAIRNNGINAHSYKKHPSKNDISRNEMKFEKNIKYSYTPGEDEYNRKQNREDDDYNDNSNKELDKWRRNGKKGKRPVASNITDLKSYIETTQAILEAQNEENAINDNKSLYDSLVSLGMMSKERAEELKKMEYDQTKSMSDQMKNAANGASKLALIGSYIKSLTQKPWKAATDAVIRMDKWIYNIFFENKFKTDGEDGSKEEQGLFGIIKTKFSEGFEDITKKISDKFSDIVDNKITPWIKKHLDPIKKFLFGEKDDNGQRSGGMFGDLIGNVKNSFKSNFKSGTNYVKEQATNLYNNVKGNSNIEETVNNIANKIGATPDKNNVNQNETMAKGGINKSGKAFHSVVSSGEIVNGNIVPPGGPYLTTIPKGGYVINPANSSTISKQASQERGFINKLKSNANADDGLSESPKVIKWMKNPENNKFAADVIAKGGIGLGAGVLLGQPLLAAGIGIISAFANKSNKFSNTIFGTATGGVDENGKLERKDDGIISKKIQEAVPDMKKFGLGGAIAGLITPFGPIGGLMIGSAIGFAKNNGLIQDTLFGENGLIGKDKKDKLKKALPAMGMGAAAAALLGPFGLVGNAVLGATAGYVTSMDKFKIAIFGEEKDVDTGKKDKDGNPIMEKKRQGGLLGSIKNGMEPLKDFGRTIVDGITDAIFGKKKGKNGKREGGLFGMAKDQIIKPIADGLKPIIQEAKNMFKKTVNSLTGMVKKHMENNVGSHTMDKLGNIGGKIGKAGIKIGKGALWLKAAPLMLGAKAIQGVGAGLRRKQIRRGEADDMTASERLAYRKQSLFMNGGDQFSEFDENLLNWSHNSSAEEMEEIQNILLMASQGENAISEKDALLRKGFDRELSEYLKGVDAGKVMNYLKGDNTNYRKAEKLLRTGDLKDHKGNIIKDSQREKLLKSLSKLKTDREGIKGEFKNLKNTKKESNKKLKDLGIDINTLDNKTAKKYVSYLDTEIVNKRAGLNPEEDPNTPLNKNTAKLSDVKEALADLIKVLTGQKEAVAKKYAEEEKKDEKEESDSDNTENKPEDKPKETLRSKLKKTKKFTPRQKALMESLVAEASEAWSNSLTKVQNDIGPNDEGEYVFVVNGREYKYGTSKEYDSEYDRCIDDYIRDRAPGLLKLPELKKEAVGKSSKIVLKLKKLGLAKISLLLAMGPAGIAGAALGYGAFKLAKWGVPKLAKGTVNIAKNIGKGIGRGIIGKKTVVGQDEDGNDIVKRKGGLIGGVRNKIDGAVENVMKKGKDAKFHDKVLAKLDDLPHKIGKKLVGDKNEKGLLSKIFGVAKVAVGVPLMVGFLKETVFPFLKNKVGPLLLGTKNQDGEYEGGLISGIVNPLRTAFRKPFQKIRDWFKGEGEFSGGTSGMPGMIKNFKSIADYFIGLWKSGLNTILSKWLPDAIGALVRNLPNIIGKALENVGPMLKNIFNSKDETKVGSSGVNLTDTISAAKNGGTTDGGTGSKGIPFYSTFGQIFNITPDGGVSSTSSGNAMASVDKVGALAGASIKSSIQSIKGLSSDSVVEGGTASSGDKIYYAKNDKNKMNPLRMDPNTGEFYKASDLSQVADSSLVNNDTYQSMITNEADAGGEAVNLNNTLGQRFVKNAAAGLFSPMYRTGRKVGGKMWAGAGKVMKHLPFMKTAGTLVEKSGNLMANANISRQGFNSLKEGVTNKLDNAKFIKEWMTDSSLSMKDRIAGVLDWNGGVTKIKNAPTKALESMKSKVTKVAEGGTKLASEVSEKGLKNTVKDKAKDTAKKAIDKVGDTKGGGVVKKIVGFLKKILNKILTCGPVKKLLAKMGKEGVSEAAEKALKEAAEKVAKEAGETLAKKGIKAIASIPVKLAAKVTPAGIAFVVADFVTGMGDARNILKITSEEIEVSDKLIAGFSKVLSGLLFILPESTCCSLILNTIGKVLFKDKVEEIKKEQADSEAALKAYNEEHGTDLSIEEYNNKFNATWYTKTKNAVSKVTKKAWGGIKKVGKTTVGKAGKAVVKGAKWLWGKLKGNAEADDGLEPMDDETLETVSNTVTGGPGVGIDNTAPLITIIGLLKNILDRLPNLSGIGKMVGNVFSKKKGLLGKAMGKIRGNANANDGLESMDPSMLGMNDTIDKSIDTATSGFEKMQTFLSRFNSQNKSSNDMINNGKIDPADKNFWKIKFTKTGNPMIDSMFKMQEYMSRLIKAPFSMVSKTMGNVNNIIGTNDYTGTTGSTSTTGTTQAQDTSEKKESIWTRIKNKFKGIFGKGEGAAGTGGVTDPNHIYQRDYNGSYQTRGDSERQTLADSGCGPAAAATVANRYGLKDNLNNAAKYATSNGYKEVNGGTYPGYFSDYLSKKGIKTNATQSNEEVIKSLAQGKPVIMMGQDKSNSGKSPYGSKYSHYVVATGIDRKGNVIVEDSEDRRSQTRYSLLDTLKNTSVKITTSGSGKYGRGQSGISVLSEYSNALVKGIYGPYYSALFGDSDGTTTPNSGSNGTTPTTGNNGNSGSTPTTGSDNTTPVSGSEVKIPSSVPQWPLRSDWLMYTSYERDWAETSIQRKIYNAWVEQNRPVSRGCLCTVDNGLYCIATTLKFGTTGDLVTVYLSNGESFNAIIADSKGADPSKKGEAGNEWGHAGGTDSAYINIIEWEVNAPNSVFQDVQLGTWEGCTVEKIVNGGASKYNSGSGRGKGSGNRSYRRGNSGKGKNYSAKTLYSNKYGRGNIRSYYGRADEEETPTEETAETDATTETTTPVTEPSKPSSALEAIGTYTGRLMKSVYGDYWKALFGSDEDTDANDQEELNQKIDKTVNTTGTIIAPFDGYFYVSQKYKGMDHDGVDIVAIDNATAGTSSSFSVYSTIDGVVSHSGWENSSDHNQGFGQYVSITDINGNVWYFGHLASIDSSVKEGKNINKGSIIGVMGSTGHSTGNHVHYCCRANGDRNNPIDITQAIGIPNEDYDDHGGDIASVTYLSQLFTTFTTVDGVIINTSTEEMVGGSGRGKSNSYNHNKTIRSTNLSKNANYKLNQKFNSSIRKNIVNKSEDDYLTEIQIGGRGKSNNHTQSGYGYFDSIRNNSIPNNYISRSNNINTDQLISILEVIADNSGKTDQIVQLLAAIVTNTSVSGNSSNNTNKINQIINQLRNNTSSAPLSGLNQVLNNNGNDIANAVYSIVKS